MNQIEPDPLRFLKSRKRKSQLTPKKYTNQSSLQLKKEQNKWLNILENKHNQKQLKLKQKINNQTKIIKYNPFKYFSHDVQTQLQKLYNNRDSNRLNQQFDQTFKKQINCINDSFRLQQNLIIPLKHNDHNDTLNLEDYFSSSKQTPRNAKINSNFMAMIAQSPIEIKNEKFVITKDNQKKRQNSFDEQQMVKIQQENELCQCPTCHRKFNPSSFNKHIKVCQKVFFNKRKQFISQKQRLSNQKQRLSNQKQRLSNQNPKLSNQKQKNVSKQKKK